MVMDAVRSVLNVLNAPPCTLEMVKTGNHGLCISFFNTKPNISEKKMPHYIRIILGLFITCKKIEQPPFSCYI